jgi:hypothetical protein
MRLRGEGEVVSSTTRKVGSLIWDAFVGEEKREKRRGIREGLELLFE